MTPLRYDPLTQALHWVIAVAVVTAYAIGLVREDLPKGDFRNWLLTLHMSIGLLVAGLSVVRIGWRVGRASPAPIAGAPVLQLAARAGHLALYVALIAVPAVGLLAAWLKGRTVGFFGLPLASPFAVDKPVAEQLEHLHGFVAHAMLLLAGGHAMVAIVHQFLLKDGTLARMLPFLDPAPKSQPAK